MMRVRLTFWGGGGRRVRVINAAIATAVLYGWLIADPSAASDLDAQLLQFQLNHRGDTQGLRALEQARLRNDLDAARGQAQQVFVDQQGAGRLRGAAAPPLAETPFAETQRQVERNRAMFEAEQRLHWVERDARMRQALEGLGEAW